MKKYFFAILTVAVALCGCSKDELLTNEQPTNGEADKSEIIEPMVFTATMEGAPETRATYNGELKCASWEVGDQVNIDGSIYEAQSSGTNTIFKKSTTPSSTEIRPSFVSSDSQGFSDAEKPSKLVDNLGVETKWCANTTHRSSDVWDIVVSTGSATKLQAIKLWNGNDTKENSGRRWKNVRVSGASSADGDYIVIKTFENLNLASDNYGLAGTLEVNATQEYSFYKVEILDVMSGDIMQMSDMKFVITQQIIDNHIAYFPASLYIGGAALPAEISETWVDGKFNMPMYATSTTTDLSFKNLCGVLKITIKSDQIAAVKRIRVRSANKAVSGPFTVDANNAAVLSDASAVANTLTVTYSDAVSTDAAGKVFYVAVPAQTYQALKIELDADGNGFTTSMTTKAATDIKLERNKIYPVTFADNAPTKGTAKATIGGKDIDVNWVQLWAGGPKFAEFNVGAANNNAEDYGGYYCWGKYIDKDTDGNYDTGTTVLSGNRDTATQLWGSNWRMPTIEEFITLANNDGSEKCTCNWVLNYNGTGINGRLFTGKDKYASNSIFFPATGCFNRAKVVDQGIDACYWSSSPGGPQGAHVLYFNSTSIETQSFSDRIAGITVRAVLAED